jgi:AcrR family transcriptional regulator
MARRDLGSRDLIAADDIDADDLDAEISGAAEVSRREARRAPRQRDRVRMSGQERREQLLDVGRKLFAEKGFEAVSVEEIASKADVSKPVVYEHFGGKEGLYAVVVDREMNHLLNAIGDALTAGSARALLEQAGLALFDYIDEYPDGFRILVRDSPVSQQTGSFASLIVDVASQVEHLLAREFHAHKINARLAPMYSQMLVGMVALTGQWWLDVRKPRKEEVVANLVNLAWNGLEHMDPKPKLITNPR